MANGPWYNYGRTSSPGASTPTAGQEPSSQSWLQRLVEEKKRKMAEEEAKQNPSLPYFEEDRQRLGGMMDGRSPFAGGEWGSLISQLQATAAGTGPSVAQDAYRNAQQDSRSALGSMARGSASPGAARAAMMQQGRIGQGMASGLATARTQEMLGAQGALTSALGARDQLNQNAYLDVLAKQLGLSKDQLMALTGNADRKAAKDKADKEAKAAKWNSLGAAAGAAAGLF